MVFPTSQDRLGNLASPLPPKVMSKRRFDAGARPTHGQSKPLQYASLVPESSPFPRPCSLHVFGLHVNMIFDVTFCDNEESQFIGSEGERTDSVLHIRYCLHVLIIIRKNDQVSIGLAESMQTLCTPPNTRDLNCILLQ